MQGTTSASAWNDPLDLFGTESIVQLAKRIDKNFASTLRAQSHKHRIVYLARGKDPLMIEKFLATANCPEGPIITAADSVGWFKQVLTLGASPFAAIVAGDALANEIHGLGIPVVVFGTEAKSRENFQPVSNWQEASSYLYEKGQEE